MYIYIYMYVCILALKEGAILLTDPSYALCSWCFESAGKAQTGLGFGGVGFIKVPKLQQTLNPKH